MQLYPLKFSPVYVQRIWGGNKLKTLLNKDSSQENIGESWEISDVKDNETFVSEGPLKGNSLKDLTLKFKGDFLGNKVYEIFGEDFPLLIKYLDAKRPLSIQVHPSNELAKERHNSFGKNEMWYIMQAEKDAELIVGFNKDVDKETYQKLLESTRLKEVLNVEKVSRGDTFYIPTGRVHAIGAGVLVAEIQQTSNITYRIYDYDRIDNITGKKRDLHTDLAIDVIDFERSKNYKTTYSLNENVSNKLVHSPYFKTNIINITKEIEKDYANIDSFVIYMCVQGNMSLSVESKEYTISCGETILIPANLKKVNLKSENAKILEVYL